MNCEQVKEFLSAYLDDVLATEERRTVATHLETCPECNGMLADFRHFDTLLFQLPRISPSASLRERIFASAEYLELTGTSGMGDRHSTQTVPYRSVRADRAGQAQPPQLVSLSGGRGKQNSTAPVGNISPRPIAARDRNKPKQRQLGQTILRIALVATVLLVLGVGGLISWNLWQHQTTTASNRTAITPPAGLQQGPLPAGVRFLFWHNGALQSAPDTGTNTRILPLTPATVMVAKNWVIRPTQAGKHAGNMIAYIDLQQGYVHLIRSDGQNDTLIQQPLLKQGVEPASVWNTATGATILNSLTWSNDGTMLAFIADPIGTPGLYIYTIDNNKLQTVALPVTGTVSHLAWSPDSLRIAFEVTHDGKSDVLDYNTQNQGILTLQTGANPQADAGDGVLSLQWSPNSAAPALTWSTGLVGHVHSIWVERVGVEGITKPILLASGDYVQADYSYAGHNGVGSWLVVPNNAGVPGDLTSIDLASFTENLTQGKQGNAAQWAPDGNMLAYFETLSHGAGKLHVINATTGVDTLVATNAEATPAPVWSTDSQHLAYSTGIHVAIVDMHAPGVSLPLKQQGTIVAISWSTASVSQLVMVIGDGQQGLYLVDTQQGTSQLLAKTAIAQSPIGWTEIP